MLLCNFLDFCNDVADKGTIKLEAIELRPVQPLMQIGPQLHVFDAKWFVEEFWLKEWDAIRKAYNDQLPGRPLTDTEIVGNCWYITNKFIGALQDSARLSHLDTSVGAAAFHADLILKPGYSLNGVMPTKAWSGHRTAIVRLTEDGATFEDYYVEPQLTYAQFNRTKVSDATAAGIRLVQFGM